LASGSGFAVRREQVVASFLVGAVVVVLGFASGLGVRTADQPAGEQPVDAAPDHASPPAGEETPPVSGGGPGSGGRQPVAGGGSPRPVTVPGTRVPDPGGGTVPPSPGPVPPSPTPPPQGPPPAPPECEPGALPTWLATAADTLVSVPVVGGVLGAPLAPVLTTPLGGTALTSIEPLGSLLGTCQPATEEQLAAVTSAVESGLIPASMVPASLVPPSEPAGS
jgi:hypothetical protein